MKYQFDWRFDPIADVCINYVDISCCNYKPYNCSIQISRDTKEVTIRLRSFAYGFSIIGYDRFKNNLDDEDFICFGCGKQYITKDQVLNCYTLYCLGGSRAAGLYLMSLLNNTEKEVDHEKMKSKLTKKIILCKNKILTFLKKVLL